MIALGSIRRRFEKGAALRPAHSTAPIAKLGLENTLPSG